MFIGPCGNSGHGVEQLDIKIVFLHGMEKDILMKQSEGFEMEGKKNFVCRLKKSLYWLKQSPRQWYKRFVEFIVSHGYIKSPYDSCVYHSKVEGGSQIYLLLYMDDMLLASQNKYEIQNLKSLLNSEFEMKDIRVAEKILRSSPKKVLLMLEGMNVNQTSNLGCIK